MPPALQAKLLRVLQEQQFERVGGNETIAHRRARASPPRIATCGPMSRGSFARDLYYRLERVRRSICRRCASAATTSPLLATHFVAPLQLRARPRRRGHRARYG